MHRGTHDFPAYARFTVSVVVLGFCLLLLPHHLPIGARLLISWNAGVLVFLGLVAWSIIGVDATQMRAHSQRAGGGRSRVLLGVLLICLAGLVAVLTIINNVHRQEPGFRLQVLLSVATVLSAWLLIQTVFGLFYARSYYCTRVRSAQVSGGIRFVGDEAPDYWDFMYFSFTVGMTYATSDTDIESRPLRRTALLQAIVSFLFYTVLIGLVMNAIATLF